MSDLLDDPWWLVILLVAGAGFVGWLAARSASRRAGAGAAALVAAAILLVGSALRHDSPRKQVTALLHQLTNAAQRGDAETIVRALSPRVVARDMKHDFLVQSIRGELARLTIEQARLDGLQIEIGAPDQAVADFNINARGSSTTRDGIKAAVPSYWMRFRLGFTKDGNRWYVTRIHRYDPSDPNVEVPLFKR